MGFTTTDPREDVDIRMGDGVAARPPTTLVAELTQTARAGADAHALAALPRRASRTGSAPSARVEEGLASPMSSRAGGDAPGPDSAPLTRVEELVAIASPDTPAPRSRPSPAR